MRRGVLVLGLGLAAAGVASWLPGRKSITSDESRQPNLLRAMVGSPWSRAVGVATMAMGGGAGEVRRLRPLWTAVLARLGPQGSGMFKVYSKEVAHGSGDG